MNFLSLGKRAGDIFLTVDNNLGGWFSTPTSTSTLTPIATATKAPIPYIPP
jgi:hypothetical protein